MALSAPEAMMVPTKMLICVIPPVITAGTASTQKRCTSPENFGQLNVGTKPARRIAAQTIQSCATPPANVPMAIQIAVCTSVVRHKTSGSMKAIITMLSRIGANEEAVKRPSPLRIAA